MKDRVERMKRRMAAASSWRQFFVGRTVDVENIVLTTAHYRVPKTGLDYAPLIERYRGDVRIDVNADAFVGELEAAFTEFEAGAGVRGAEQGSTQLTSIGVAQR